MFDFLSYVRPDPGRRYLPYEARRENTDSKEVPVTTGPTDDTEAMTDVKGRPANGPGDEATTAGKTEPEVPIRTTIDRGIGGTTVDLSPVDAARPRQRAEGPDQWDRSEFPLELDRLRRALPQLARGVLALHGAGKLHRDIKRSNVLVREDGTVLLLDFGLVAELETEPVAASPPGISENSEIDNMVVGTVGYMAPEQAAGEPLTRASDWYAVGVMLFEALTGRLPFRGGVRQILSAKQENEALPPIELDPSVPPDLNQLCVDLLRRDPVERLSGPAILARLGEEAPCGSMAEAEILAPSVLLVGRGEELASLDGWFAEVLAGKAATVEVHGRSGAGKSSLVQRFLDGLAADRNVVILAGRCFEQESIPYKAVDQLVDALTRYLCRLRHAEALTLMPRDIGALRESSRCSGKWRPWPRHDRGPWSLRTCNRCGTVPSAPSASCWQGSGRAIRSCSVSTTSSGATSIARRSSPS